MNKIKSNTVRFTLAAFFLCLVAGCDSNNNSLPSADITDPEAPDPITDCTISESQVLSPTLLTEVPNGQNADLCDFNVMAWENFLYLVSPSAEGSDERRFEVGEDYPNYLGSGADSCDPDFDVELVSLGTSATVDTVGPDSEAGTTVEVYSVNNGQESEQNIVLYNIRFSRDLCEESTSPLLPVNLIEIKTAWRYFTPNVDQGDYYTIDVTLDTGEEARLGLIGFHLAQSTELHPEMIWTTWEHVDNSPDCVPTESSPAQPTRGGWTMMTNACSDCIGPDGLTDCDAQCTNSEGIYINEGRSDNTMSPPFLADSTNICRVFPEGTQDGDNQSDQNRSNIRSLNDQIIGPEGYLAQLAASNPQAVWQNYRMIGGIWFNNDGMVEPTEQRGSIQLTNSVMETTFQGMFTPGPGGSTSSDGDRNCFFCHKANDYSMTRDSGLSHIASSVNGN